MSIKKDRDIHVTKADKASVIVLLDRTDYVNKMYTLLNDVDTYERLISDPLERINAHFHKKIRDLFGKNQTMIDKFRSMNAKLPYLYGTVKTHKDGYPMRPIISTVGTVSYELSKYLVHLLQPLVGTISNSHVHNSTQFVDMLQRCIPAPDDVMVSFDVKSLFTCVPINDVLDFLRVELSKYALTLPVWIVLELIQLCVVDTCFTFNGEFFKQKFGMQMGNCLSPVMSSIYMEYFELRIANAIIPENVFWKRYVDDTFVILKSFHNIDEIVEHLNDLVPSIKFTVEKEENKSIAFLDVTVIRHENSFKFKVYRKSTNNNLIINAHSTHSESVKQSSLRSMFLRAHHICSPEYFDDEISNIHEIGYINNFKKHEIDRCLDLAKRTFYNKEKRNIKSNYISLPYHPLLRDIVYPMKLLGFKVAFSYQNTIGKTLIRNSPLCNEGIVYKIPCGCGRFYVGQSGKPLDKKISQQKYNISRNDQRNAINIHTQTRNFSMK